MNKEPVFPEPGKKFITFNEATKDLPKQIVPELSPCFLNIIPKMKQGQSVADYLPGKHFQTERIFENKVCPTITKVIGGIGFGALIHPKENRVLSIAEFKRCCSFPDSFIFIGKYQEQKARLGNAVMPNMMKAIALTIKESILQSL